MQVDQSGQCGTSGSPWQMLVGPNALPNGFYNISADFFVAVTNYNPNDPSDNGDGRLLQLGTVMLQPLWPTVSVQAVGWSQPKVTPADQLQYGAWEDSGRRYRFPWRTAAIARRLSFMRRLTRFTPT